MALLLDTHALIWWYNEASFLSERATAAIRASDQPVYVSAVSAWEIATKHRLGKLPEVEYLVRNFFAELEKEGFFDLPVTTAHGLLAGQLGGDHKDPFDRMLIAQAQIEHLTLVSNEAAFDRFGIVRLW
jgi:PIN domain nuclease of toxin-antitoxin system